MRSGRGKPRPYSRKKDGTRKSGVPAGARDLRFRLLPGICDQAAALRKIAWDERRSAEMEGHFVGGLEAEGVIHGAAGGTGVKRDGVESFVAAPVDHHLEQPFRDAGAAGRRLREHVENPGAFCVDFAGIPRPDRKDNAAPAEHLAVRVLREPTFVCPDGERDAEVLAREFVHPGKHGRILKSHFFKHGSAVMQKVVQVVEGGRADAEVHGVRCCGEGRAIGRDKMVVGS